MQKFSRALSGMLFAAAMLVVGSALTPSTAAAGDAGPCDTLTCTATACCTINSQTGAICDCEKLT